MKRRAFVGSLVLSSILFNVPATWSAQAKKETAEPPEDRKNNKPWIQRHQMLVKRSQSAKFDVIFLGDSITQGWEGPAGMRVWQKHLAPLKAGNFGIGGDQTHHVLWRLQNGELEPQNPKVAVIMIGTNNSGRDDAKTIADGIEAIVKELREKRPKMKILLLGIFPRSAKPGDPVRAKLKEVNEMIAKLEDRKNVKFVDIGERFLEKDGTLSKAVMPDYLHLSERGYQIWAEAIVPPLRAMMKSK